jgi:hypothetical protein
MIITKYGGASEGIFSTPESLYCLVYPTALLAFSFFSSQCNGLLLEAR